MSDRSARTPRRTRPAPKVAPPSGYRSTRRGSKSAKSAKRALKYTFVTRGFDRLASVSRRVGMVLAVAVGALLATTLVLLILASAINGFVRWNAHRIAARSGTAQEVDRRAKENLLVVGVENGKAVGFLAMRVDRKGRQVFGIAIPDGAFLEVPGQGFERAGESYAEGAEISMSTVSNYLTVPFRNYLVVPAEVYRTVLKEQSVTRLADATQDDNLSEGEFKELAEVLGKIPQKNTALVPLPVKPIKLGEQTYFEPQRAQVADLLKSWWGVDATRTAKVTRVIVYNGAGIPGVAGEAAQQLIRNGFRVVDTKNADNFDYKTTQVVVQRGSAQQGNEISRVLDAGSVSNKPSDQDVADVIVIIGKDYKPPVTGGQGGNK